MADFIMFVLFYSFLKVIRIMAAATLLMVPAVTVCTVFGFRTWRLNLAVLAFVPVACLTGYSKIFYTGKMVLFTNWLTEMLTNRMAVLYFGIAGIFAVHYLCVQIRLRRGLRRMQEVTDAECPVSLRRGAGPAIHVYLSEAACGPFAGGIARPFIVVSRQFKNSLTKEEWDTLLCHEALHIRQGHILLLHVYALLKILWWIHPLVYLCDRKLRENVEYSSDEGSVLLGSLSAYAYAGIILKALSTEEQVHSVQQGTAAFLPHSFDRIKKRLEKLGTIQKNKAAVKQYKKKKQAQYLLFAAALLAAVVLVFQTSFPRYTRLEEISVFDQNLQPLTYSLKDAGFEAEIRDGQFYMSEREFGRLLSEYELQGEYLIFGYGTIMKLPGIGGLGQAALVSISDPSSVSLLGREEWMGCLAAFILKFVI